MPTRYKVTLSTESPNDRSMIVLTRGIEYTDYQANPVLLYMHKRGNVIGNVFDIAIETDQNGKEKLVGYLVFGTTKECKEYETLFATGVLRAVSIGIAVLESYQSNGFTMVMRSRIAEVSVVDIPANSECLKEEQFVSGDFVALFTSLTQPTVLQMKTLLIALGLPDTANEQEALQAIDKLKTQVNALQTQTSAAVDAVKLQAELQAKTNELRAKTDELNKFKAEHLVELALANGKILPTEKEQFTKLATVDFATTQTLLNNRPAYVPITEQIRGTNLAGANAKPYTWDELHRESPKQLEKLKNQNPALYASLYYDKFGKQPDSK